MTGLTVSETLYRAADLIEERGWTRGGEDNPHPWGPDGSEAVCLEGALAAATGLMSTWDTPLSAFYKCPAHNAVCAYLERNPSPQSSPIVDALWQWNDDPGRTASEVIEVLRACAVIEAAKEQETAWATYSELVTV